MCTKEEQRAVIQFLWSEGVPGAEIHRRLSTQYGDSALSRRSVYKWIEKFTSGRTNMTHEEGAGGPSISTTDEKIQQAREMALANRRVAINTVACSLQISHGSAYQIIHDSARYSDLLTNKLKPAVRTKRRGLLSKKVLLLHDNARTHTASHNVETINHLGFEVQEHPAYSPHHAPSDYHLFGPLKNALRGHQFSTDKEVREAVHKWLHNQPKTFFLEGIRKIVDCWTKCIEKEGDYVEK